MAQQVHINQPDHFPNRNEVVFLLFDLSITFNLGQYLKRGGFASTEYVHRTEVLWLSWSKRLPSKQEIASSTLAGTLLSSWHIFDTLVDIVWALVCPFVWNSCANCIMNPHFVHNDVVCFSYETSFFITNGIYSSTLLPNQLRWIYCLPRGIIHWIRMAICLVDHIGKVSRLFVDSFHDTLAYSI